MSLLRTWKRYRAGTTAVLPVYLSERVLSEILAFLAAHVPNEGILKVFGYDCVHDGEAYARITDWFAGEQLVTPVTATFTDAGLREIELARRDRYPERDSRPLELGVAHSHPFGHEPEFSGVDRATFTTFPYGANNVHLLLDPTAGFCKAYIGYRRKDRTIGLREVAWGLYRPQG